MSLEGEVTERTRERTVRKKLMRVLDKERHLGLQSEQQLREVLPDQHNQIRMCGLK